MVHSTGTTLIATDAGTTTSHAEGFRVIRITNDKVFSDIDAVLELILNALE